MIAISVVKNEQEYPLLLGNLSKTSVEEFESIFELDVAIKSGYTLNVKIPVEGNEMALNHAHAVHIREDDYIFFIRIYDNGVAAFEASLVIEKSDISFEDSFYDCNIIFNTFSIKSQGKLLKDVLTKGIQFGNSVEELFTDITDYFINSDWPIAAANFPVTRIIDKDDNTIVANDYDINNDLMVDAGSENSDFSNPTIPHPYYAEVLRETFKAFGYKATGPIFQDLFFTSQLMPNYKPMYDVHRPHEIRYRTTEDQLIDSRMAIEWGEVLWNSSSFTPTLPGTTVFSAYSGYAPTLVELKLRVKSIDEGGKVRIYRRAAGFYNPSYPADSAKEFFAVAGDTVQYSFNPKDFSTNVLSEIEINCGNDSQDWVGDPWDEVEPNYAEKFVLEAGSEVVIYASNTATLPDFNRYMKTSMILGEMVPPLMTVSDFLFAVKTAFQLKIDIDEASKEVYIMSATDAINNVKTTDVTDSVDAYEKEPSEPKSYRMRWKNQTESLDGLLKLGTVASAEDLELGLPENSCTYVMAENAYYKSDGFSYQYHTIRNDELKIGNSDESTEIEIPIEMIQMRSIFPSYPKGTLPTLLVEKVAEYNGVKDEDWNLMIMTYYGVAENKEGEFRPWATSASYDWRGNFLPMPGHPLYDLEYSMWVKYHKNLIELLTAPIIFTIRIIKNYSNAKNQIKRKKLVWRGNHFIEKRSLGYLGDSESTTEIEMIRL